ncbi:Hypothetical protein SCF082_LOCUS49806 [Durusdinium trenchii]|uniref:Uncharacterized protein n=1 Tax=Durusdinium trenchii TaxID=1381693 RepID=A0ABP0S3N1_9DINO
MPQGPAAGQQKMSTRKVDDPFQKRYVLIYSLGDEMYKWASPTSIFHSFEEWTEETYSYPPGWGREEKTFEVHLRNYKGHRFNGARAWKEAKDTCLVNYYERPSATTNESYTNGCSDHLSCSAMYHRTS